METGVVAITIKGTGDFFTTTRPRSFVPMIDEMLVHELVQEILVAKQNLLSKIKLYTDAVVCMSHIGEHTTKRQQRKMNFQRNSAEALYKDFAALLNDFIIEDARKVHYNNVTYTQSEPVRRLTKNHLAFLREKKSELADIPGAMEAYREYKSLVEDFLPYIKYEI